METALIMLWNALFPALLTVVTALAGYAAKVFIDYLDVRIGREQEELIMGAGYKAWAIVEEYYRMNPGFKTGVDSKLNKFESEIRKFVPFITKEEIESIRQAIAGQLNAGKELKPEQ